MENIQGSYKSLYSLVTDKDKKLNIPYYQRPYSWNDEQLEDFWTSIVDGLDEDKELFFGSIITTESSKIKEALDIVDGQQRIVTFTILFLVFLHKYPEIDPCFVKTFQVVEDFLKQESSSDFRLNVLDSDSDYFESIQIVSLDNKEYNNKFLDSYYFFFKKLDELIKERNENKDNIIKKLVYFIKNKLNIIHIEALSEDIAIDAFQAINSMGMSLDEENIVKSILLQKNDNKLTQKWEECFRTNKFDNGYFFYYYLNIKYSEILKEKGIKKEKLIKIFYNELKDKRVEEKVAEANKIIDYSRIYVEILEEKNQDFQTKDYFYCIKTFQELGMWVFTPVLLKAVYEKQDIKKISEHLESIIMSYLLQGKSFSGFNKMLPELLSNPFSIQPSYDEEKLTHYLLSGYSNLNNKKAKSILYLLDIKYINNASNVVKVAFNNKLSLEHIYSQTPREDTEKLKNEKLKNSIGNMMILSKSWNSKNSNKAFIEKVKLYDKDTIGFLTTSQYVENIGKKENPVWLDEQIEENAEILLGLIKKTWINQTK